jgi:hypothetical protein
MAQYSSWMHDVAAQQEADVKQNESVAASSILSLILQSRRHPILAFYIAQKEGKSGGAQRFYFAIPTPNIVLGARAIAAWSVHQALSSARAHALSRGGFCISKRGPSDGSTWSTI